MRGFFSTFRFMKHIVCFVYCLPLIAFAQKKENIRNRSFAHYGELFHDSVPSLGAVIIWRNDEVLLENYFNGTSDTTLFKVKSITKTITSTLAGIAQDKGLLPALDTPVSTLFPEYTFPAVDSSNRWFPELMTDIDSLKKLVTLQHLLTMQTGYLWDDQNPLSHRVFLSSSDPVRHMLELPFESIPGTTFNYCTGASHLMGAVIEKSVQQPLNEFAEQQLFTPLGITTYDWTCDARGRTAGGTELSLRANDLLQFGLLYLNKGNYLQQQIVSKAWVEAATSAQIPLPEWDVLPGSNGYGYYWWRRLSNGHQVIVASGYGGQLICIVPDLKLIVVTTCLINDENRGRSEIKRLHLLIDKVIEDCER